MCKMADRQVHRQHMQVTHTYLWGEGLHDGTRKLRIATENIVEALRNERALACLE